MICRLPRIGVCLLLIGLAFPASAAFADSPVDHWGTRTASPAVVNAATVSPLQEIISLRGDWDFVTDPILMGRHRMGKGPGWNEPDWPNPRKLQVPGCWEAQGVGGPGTSLTWSLPFDCCPRPLNHIYMGTARYRRSVDIPEGWKEKRIWLKVGGVRTEAWIWVNHERVAHLNTYCGSYKYDITDLVTPGQKAEIVATVTNDTPSRKGCMAVSHRFGGFYRDLELEATPASRIDDVWVRSSLEPRAAQVHVALAHTGSVPPSDLALKVAIQRLDGSPITTFAQKLDAKQATDVVCEIPMPDCPLWTPETPNLYRAEVTLLSSSTPIHGWTERFGLRKLEVRGNRFFLNGKPYFLRGFGDDSVYPLTLSSPADRQEHLRHLRLAHQAGFNYVRLHTHCENPEYFEAADEAGILIQPELPYYHDIPTEGFEFDPLRDLEELFRHFRRYTSFAAYSLGNEGHIGSPLDRELYQWAKQNDPDRIFQHQDGGCNTTENADFFTPNGYGLASSILPWEPGTFDSLSVPFVAHEYLNLGIKMDPRTAPKFTGALAAPRSLERYEASLQEAGLDRAWGDACLNTAHALQGYYQKCGLEQARRDPACDGYSFWTIVDVMVPQEGSDYTGQGFLNAFWESKPGGWTAEQFRTFNGPTTLLATIEPASAIAVCGEKGKVALSLSHFGGEDLRGAQITWTLRTEKKTLASGTLPPLDIAPGDVRPIGVCEFTVPELEQPVHARLEARLSAEISNAWDFWFFPKRAPRSGKSLAASEDLLERLAARYPGIAKLGTAEAANAQLVLGSWDHPALLEATRNGRRGIMLGPAEGEPNVTLGWWWLGNQLGTAFADHPAFGGFPHDGTLSPLWFRLIKQGLALPIDPKHGRPTFLAVGEGRNQYFAYLWQNTAPDGRTLLITRGLDLLADTPEGTYLLDAMVDYARSDAFTASQPAKPREPRPL